MCLINKILDIYVMTNYCMIREIYKRRTINFKQKKRVSRFQGNTTSQDKI